MESLVEEDTLGKKHQNFNRLVNEAIKNNPSQEVTDINYEDPDLDNLFKIDIASNNRNVEYILKVLKCNDMLYISRAIKRSTWLITDPKYAHIINPQYLFHELFPQMTAKACNKLMLQIRLNLKDEKRVEDFFSYYKDQDLNTALKWLPNCSPSFIENIIEKHANEISKSLLKRLCEKSVHYLEIFCRHYKLYYKREMLLEAMFLINTNMEKYLDIVESTEVCDVPYFKPKFTKLVMTKCPERIINNLDKYVNYIDKPTFAKFIKQEEVKEFILNRIKKKEIHSWFGYDKLKHFINRLPIECRFEFVKELFIDKTHELSIDDECLDNVPLEIYACSMPLRISAKSKKSATKNNYCWYVFAPFYTAFLDLKKLIRSESNPSERMLMSVVMLSCARNNPENVSNVLKYYREQHINEPFKFKMEFVNCVISKCKTHSFDATTWGYLNDIYTSMEVYSESDKYVQSCINSIILYNVIHDKSVPEIIEKKFVFETLKKYIKKLNQDEKEKVFNYLYNYMISKIENMSVTNENKFGKYLSLLENILNLLIDWEKELQDYPSVLQKIKDIIMMKKQKSWHHDISSLYNLKKSWKKLLFSESILINPSQEACVNALKHGPQLLDLNKKEIDALCTNDTAILVNFFRKVRIYWPHTLANNFRKMYLSKLDQKSNHKSIIVGLCALLSRKELLDLAQKYVPPQSKIDWGQVEELELSLRKHIAANLHLARPYPSLTTALSYAKGDYLQYALPSLNAILYNMSSEQAREDLSKLLKAPVSLQKHGIRISFSKLNHEELKKIFNDIWQTTKNSSIRTDIFKQTYNMLCKERNPLIIEDIWELLSVFIDNLSNEENKIIYNKLAKIDKVPLSVRPRFWMKSYKFLKSLPPKANCSSLVDTLIRNMHDIMEHIDNDFMNEIIFESFDKKFSTQQYSYSYLLASFVLCTKTEEAQMERYAKIFVPILEYSFTNWDKKHKDNYFVRYNLYSIFNHLATEFERVVLCKEMIIPIAMFSNISEILHKNFELRENYNLITWQKLTLCYIKILDKVLKEKKDTATSSDNADECAKWKPLYFEAAQEFGKICIEYLKEDVQKFFPSIYVLFAEAFNNVMDKFECGQYNKLRTLETILGDKDFIEGHLLAVHVMPRHVYEDKEKALKSALLKQINEHPSDEIKMHYYLFEKKCMRYL